MKRQICITGRSICLWMLLIQLLCTGKAYTQGVEQISGAINVGVSFPVGNFASANQNYLYADGYGKASGLAKPGPATQGSLDFHVKKNWGFSMIIGGQQNKQDETAFAKNIKQLQNSSQDYLVTTGSWKIFKALLGVHGSIPIIPGKILFRPKILAGILKTSIPKYQYITADRSSASGQRDAVSLPISFCFELSGSLEFNVSKYFFVSTQLEYFNAAGNRGTQSYQYSGSIYYTTNHIPVASINLMGGLGYRF